MFAIDNLTLKRIHNGRLFIYNQDTTDLANVYTYENSQYVDAPNPIYFVEGVPNNTYFLNNGIYDCVAQEYVGDSSDPSGDLRPEMWVEEFSTKIGFELEVNPNESEDVVSYTSINALLNAPVGGYANVIGYWSETDCEPRTYYWDSTCVNDADGGLIIQSNNSDTGRWILLVNEIMKSEYYGVYGTHQENLINLFRYNDLYGSMSLCSPKTIMLAPGEYGDGYTLYNANGKRVIFSKGASIKSGNTVRCESYEGTGVIGKLICNCPARLSNFRELSDFLNCGSSTLIFDRDGGNTLSLNKTLTGVCCIFEQAFGIGSGAGHLSFDSCAIESCGMIIQNGNIHFRNCAIKESWFSNPRMVTPDAAYDTNITILPNNFTYAECYFRYMNLGSPSALNLDCAGMRLQTSYVFGGTLQDITISNLNTSARVGIGCSSATLKNCNLRLAQITSPNTYMYNTTIEEGYVSGTSNGTNKIVKHFDNCNFGSAVDFRMESTTAIDLYAKDCKFGDSNRQVFYSNNGLDISRIGSKTYFKNNVGIGDNYYPYFLISGSTPYPASIASGILHFNDEVGTENWRNGDVFYNFQPWILNYNIPWVNSLNNAVTSELYEPGTKDITYSYDFPKWADGKVYVPQSLSISAKFADPKMINISAFVNNFKVYLERSER